MRLGGASKSPIFCAFARFRFKRKQTKAKRKQNECKTGGAGIFRENIRSAEILRSGAFLALIGSFSGKNTRFAPVVPSKDCAAAVAWTVCSALPVCHPLAADGRGGASDGRAVLLFPWATVSRSASPCRSAALPVCRPAGIDAARVAGIGSRFAPVVPSKGMRAGAFPPRLWCGRLQGAGMGLRRRERQGYGNGARRAPRAVSVAAIGICGDWSRCALRGVEVARFRRFRLVPLQTKAKRMQTKAKRMQTKGNMGASGTARRRAESRGGCFRLDPCAGVGARGASAGGRGRG